MFVNLLDYNIVVSEYELQSHYCVHLEILWTHSSISVPRYWLYSIAVIFSQGWFRQLITYEDWYAINKKNNDTNPVCLLPPSLSLSIYLSLFSRTHIFVCVFTRRHVHKQNMTEGLYSDLSFSWTGYLTKAKEASLPCYLPIAGEQIDSCISQWY